MAEQSAIEWTDATWNIITGCSIVSPGCRDCYAMTLAGTRLKNHPSRVGLTKDTKAGPVWTGEVRFNREWLYQPILWRRPRMIFVCAHGDLFHEGVTDEQLDRIFAVMALAERHIFQVLTKRSARMRAYLADPNRGQRIADAMDLLIHHENFPLTNGASNTYYSRFFGKDEYWNGMTVCPLPLPNVWIGVSAEDQTRADERVPDLLATPAAVRWVSAEPLLGPIDFSRYMWPVHDWWDSSYRSYEEAKAAGGKCGRKRQALVGAWVTFIDWIVAGGESGATARPMNRAWARQIRDDCEAAGTAFLFKQWGTWAYGAFAPEVLDAGSSSFHRFEDGTWMRKLGKKAAGRLLDGREHNGMPGAA